MARNDPATISFRRRHLPHWTVTDRAYFVTIRLKGSLPKAVSAALKEERIRFLQKSPSEEEMTSFDRERFRRIDQILDACVDSPQFLSDGRVARLVIDAFTWLEEEKGWEVHALTILPNHTHVLLHNRQGQNDELAAHLGVLKGYTARQANKLLGRTGRSFWMDENFDHWCRTEQEFLKSARYIARNPVKAGLTPHWSEWPWTRIKSDLHRFID